MHVKFLFLSFIDIIQNIKVKIIFPIECSMKHIEFLLRIWILALNCWFWGQQGHKLSSWYWTNFLISLCLWLSMQNMNNHNAYFIQNAINEIIKWNNTEIKSLTVWLSCNTCLKMIDHSCHFVPFLELSLIFSLLGICRVFLISIRHQKAIFKNLSDDLGIIIWMN